MSEEIRQCQRVEAVHRAFWLPSIDCRCWRPNLLSSWRSLTINRHPWSDQTARQSSGSTSWRVSKDIGTLLKLFIIDLFAISCGQTLTIDAVGVSHQEVPAILSDKISLNSLTMQTIWNWYQELISWWWMDTIGLMKGMWLLSSLLLTTATAVVTRQLLWKSMNSWSIRCKYNPLISKLFLSLQFDPAPRQTEPNISKRTPDYFLWSAFLA